MRITTHIADSDGQKVQNLSMLGISESNCSVILHMWDYDEDGIPDVVEKWFGNASIVTNHTYRQEFRTFIAEITTLVEKIAVVIGAVASLVELGWDWINKGGD